MTGSMGLSPVNELGRFKFREAVFLVLFKAAVEASTIAKYEKLRELHIMITPNFTGEASTIATLENLESITLYQIGQFTGELSDFANLKKLKRLMVSDDITGSLSDLPGGFDATKVNRVASHPGIAVYRNKVSSETLENLSKYKIEKK